MTQEEKELLLKDLCARSFYSVKVTVPIMSFINGQGPYTEPIELISVNALDMTCTVGNRYAQTSSIMMFDRKGELICKPYLRPMSSMTENEKFEQKSKMHYEGYFVNPIYFHTIEEFDYLNSIHVDYRGFIEKGLAFEAPEGMYETNEK